MVLPENALNCDSHINILRHISMITQETYKTTFKNLQICIGILEKEVTANLHSEPRNNLLLSALHFGLHPKSCTN